MTISEPVEGTGIESLSPEELVETFDLLGATVTLLQALDERSGSEAVGQAAQGLAGQIQKCRQLLQNTQTAGVELNHREIDQRLAYLTDEVLPRKRALLQQLALQVEQDGAGVDRSME